MEEESRRRPGSLFVAIGASILMLVVASNVFGWRLGPLTSFFEDAILLPVALIFVGRALNRRARRASTDLPPQTVPRTSPPPPPSPAPVRAPGPTPPVPTPLPPAPPLASTPDPKPSPVGADIRPAMTTPRPPAAIAQSGNPHEVHRARSSEEMIAEAKRKLAERGSHRPNAAS